MIKNIRGIKFCGTKDCKTVTEMGEAFGGGIYSASCTIGFSNAPTKITLNIVSENSDYTIDRDKHLNVTDTGANTIQIGGVTSATGPGGAAVLTGEVTFRRMYLYSFTKNNNPGSKTLSVNFVDHSIMLDKIFVGLIGRHGTRTNILNTTDTQYNPANDVQVTPVSMTFGFRLHCLECNELRPSSLLTPPSSEPPHKITRLAYMAGTGVKCTGGKIPLRTYINVKPGKESVNGGYILLGQEQFKETECEIPRVTYTFEDLCNALDYILGGDPEDCTSGGDTDKMHHHNLRDFNRSITYEANYTGTLREVLSAWAADFSFDFTFDYESSDIRVIGIDLKEAIDLTDVKQAIESGFGPDSKGGLIRTHTETNSLENTYYQTPLVKFIKPPRPFSRQKIHYQPRIGKVLTPREAIGSSANLGRTDDEMHVSMALAKYSPEARLIWLSDLARRKSEDVHWCNKFHAVGANVPWPQANGSYIPAKDYSQAGYIGGGWGNPDPGPVGGPPPADYVGVSASMPSVNITPLEFEKYAGIDVPDALALSQQFKGGCAPNSQSCTHDDCLDTNIVTAATDSPCKCPKTGAFDHLFNPFKHGYCSNPNYSSAFSCLSIKNHIGGVSIPMYKWTPNVNDIKLQAETPWPALGFFPSINFNKFIDKTVTVPHKGYQLIENPSGSAGTPSEAQWIAADLKPVAAGVAVATDPAVIAGMEGTDPGVLELWNPAYLVKGTKRPDVRYINPALKADPLTGKLVFATSLDANNNAVINGCTLKDPGFLYPTYRANPPEKSECINEGNCYHYHERNRNGAAHFELRTDLAAKYDLCTKQAHPIWCDAGKFSVYLGIWSETYQDATGEFDKELADNFLGKYGYWYGNRTSDDEVELGIFNEGPMNPPPDERQCPKVTFDLEGCQQHALYKYEHRISTLPESKIYSGHSYPFDNILRAHGGFFALPQGETDTDPHCTYCPQRSIFEIEDNAWGTPPDQVTAMLRNKYIIDSKDTTFYKDPNVISDLGIYRPKYARIDRLKQGVINHYQTIVGLENWKDSIMKPEYMKSGYAPGIAFIPHLDKMTIDNNIGGATPQIEPLLKLDYDHWTCTKRQVEGAENADGKIVGTCSDPFYSTSADCITHGHCSNAAWHTKIECELPANATVTSADDSTAKVGIWYPNTWTPNVGWTAAHDHWCYTGACVSTAITTTSAPLPKTCYICLEAGETISTTPVKCVYTSATPSVSPSICSDDILQECSGTYTNISSYAPDAAGACSCPPCCPATTTGAPVTTTSSSSATTAAPSGTTTTGAPVTTTPSCAVDVGVTNKGSEVFGAFVYSNYARRKEESRIGSPKECILYCEEDIKSEICDCPDIEEPIHQFQSWASKYLKITHITDVVNILYPIEHNYKGFWVSEQEEKGTTMKKQIVMGEPPVPDQLKSANVMATRIIDIDATPELDALEATTAGKFEERLVVTNSHLSPPQPEVVSLPQYYTFVQGIAQSADQPGETINVKLDGTEFDTFRETLPDGTSVNLLTPANGLATFTISLDGEGISTSLSFRSRPKKLPKRDVLLQKIGPRALEGQMSKPTTNQTRYRALPKS
jgi:hypothetical protein